jgi:hypothetical protein
MPVMIFKCATRNLIGCALGLLLIAIAAGCASRPPERWDGPVLRAETTLEPWRFQRHDGHSLRTPHYMIHTTIQDEDTIMQIGQVMEGALLQYRQLAPATPRLDGPMECYFFATRGQWDAYTRRHAGPAASVYLQITRGGYAVGDRYVAYYIGAVSTWSVAAHEGWHQYVARHFKGRLPPFLEEGIACLFEHVRWENDLPRWNLSINPSRALSLRRTLEGRHEWPLEQLIAMHAGDVVGQPPARIEAYYAQSWAFARFLNEAQNGKHRPALQRMLRDTAAGTVHDSTGTHRSNTVPWNPRSVGPLLEHYLGSSLPEIERAFGVWMHDVAYRQLNRQWR